MLRLNQYDQVIHAALAGQGVALGRLELLQPLLVSGQLACLPEGVVKDAGPRSSPFGYWLLQAEAAPRDEVRRVAEWIQAEARAIRPRPGGATRADARPSTEAGVNT